jgi:membrane associated rhomboid family serine protease
MKIELSKIVKGILEFKRVFFVYSLVLLTSVIIFGVSQVYPNIENTLSASRSTPWGIITSIFAHINISHLALNMGGLFLFMFLFAFCNSTFILKSKRRVEIFFLVSVFVFAVISNVLWIALTPNPSIGASGLVYAVESSLAGFSFANGLQLLYFSKFKAQSVSTMYIVFMNIVVFSVMLIQIVQSPDIFLNVGQGVNIIAHGISFLLGFLISPLWYYVIGKISILN